MIYYVFTLLIYYTYLYNYIISILELLQIIAEHEDNIVSFLHAVINVLLK